MPIHVLPDEIIAQIAAGEVVERPASVVKELLENALDASASSIAVVIEGGGRKRIRVSDNGVGMTGDEVELAFLRHATSKVERLDDLNAIRTLGFRGEALFSIAAVSRVTLMTRHRDDEIGTKLLIEGGISQKIQPVGAPAGTVIDVEQLFFNTPARLKFLKKATTEKRHITGLITRYAMAYPATRFILEHDGREAFRSNGSGTLADVLVQAVGLENLKQMVSVEIENPAREGRPRIQVSGYTSTDGYTRADRSQITFFVNGRWVQDSNLTYAVVQAYHTVLPSGRYPVAVLMITLSPEDVDVNVHPTKAEVRFRDINMVFAAVQRGVREAILQMPMAPRIGETTHERSSTLPLAWGDTSRHPDASWDQPQMRDPSAGSTVDDDTYDVSHIPEGAGIPSRPRTLPLLRVVGQVGAVYVVAEGPAGLYLIDQNAAHERILYEALSEQYVGETVESAVLTAPQPFDVPAALVDRLEASLYVVVGLGFAIEEFGPNTFVLRRVPQVLRERDSMEIGQMIVSAFQEIVQDQRDDVENMLIEEIAALGAVRAGQILSLEEMQGLVRRLERCSTPLAAPDGRTTFIHLSGDQLAREFGR